MTPTLEERVSALEAKLEKVLAPPPLADTPWWESFYGRFQHSPHFEGALRRGAEYRRNQPNAADNPEAVE